eukprot:scaffold3004_cov119-Skeletonema_dohrnii-CCMP3373.AAC.4
MPKIPAVNSPSVEWPASDPPDTIVANLSTYFRQTPDFQMSNQSVFVGLFRNHALLRGGSRIVPPASSSSSSPVDEVKEEVVVQTRRKKSGTIKEEKGCFQMGWGTRKVGQ